MLNARFVTLVGMTLAAAGTRLLPHPPNLTPIAAMALFGGAHFASPLAAFSVPLFAMLLSDLLLGFGLHPVMPFVYGSFAVTVCPVPLHTWNFRLKLVPGATWSMT